MAALKYPFEAETIPMLENKIKLGIYDPLPAQFSDTISGILSMMLKRNQSERPTIHQLLKNPALEREVQRYTSTTEFKNEFAHSLIFN